MKLSIKSLSIVTALSSSLLLAGCFGDKKLSCSDKQGIELVKTSIAESIEKGFKKDAAALEVLFGDTPNLSAIRASLNSLGLDIKDIRISKEDPNSTKVYCEGNLEVTIPSEMLKTINTKIEDYEFLGASDLESLMEKANYELSSDAANAYKVQILYDLQPSDDGKQIFAKIENKEISEGISALVILSLLNPSTNNGGSFAETVSADASNATSTNQSDSTTPAVSEVEHSEPEAEFETADLSGELAQAKAAFDQGHADLNATWKSLSSETKDNLREEQRASNTERESTCRALANETGTTGDEKELIRLNCEVEHLTERTAYLSQFQ